MAEPRELSMPGISNMTSDSVKGYVVKFFKADIDDLEDVTMLQEIETRGLQGKDVVILEHDKFVFMERYFILVKYMEKVSRAD